MNTLAQKSPAVLWQKVVDDDWKLHIIIIIHCCINGLGHYVAQVEERNLQNKRINFRTLQGPELERCLF